MMELRLKIEDVEDLKLLLPLLERLGVDWESSPSTKEPMSRTREELLEIIREGGDASSFGDPVEWQMAERTDRNLPGRS